MIDAVRGSSVSIVGLAVGLTSCRAVEPVEPAAPVVTREEVESTEDREVAAPVESPTDGPNAGPSGRPNDGPAELEVAAAQEPAAREPEVEPVTPQTVVPIELPFSPQALVIRPVDDISPVVLFPEEAHAVRRRLAKVLAARGHAVVPVDELERIEAAAAQGRLVLEGDQDCRAPLLPDEVVARYFADRRFAEVTAMCAGDARDCTLQVLAEDPQSSDFFESYHSRRVSRPHDPRAWVDAAGRLQTTFALGGIGLGASGSSHPPPIRFVFPLGIGPWSSPLEDAWFFAVEGLAAACAHPDPRVGFTYEVRASVDRRGKLSRCEARSDHTAAREADGVCVCEALRSLELPKGRPGRRFRVQAIDDGGFRVSPAKLEPLQADTETWVRRIDESPGLSRCLDSVSLPAGLDAVLTLALEPNGTASEVRVDGDITTPPAISLARCLVQELRALPLPCRPPGIERLQVKLVIPPT